MKPAVEREIERGMPISALQEHYHNQRKTLKQIDLIMFDSSMLSDKTSLTSNYFIPLYYFSLYLMSASHLVNLIQI